MCKYDLLGTCNDSNCSYWHFKDKCNLSTDDIIKDLVAYDLHAFNATTEMSDEKKRKLLDSFTRQFHEQYSGKMSSDEKLLLLWNQLKETRRWRNETTYECIQFQKRNWFLNKNADNTLNDKQSVEQYVSSSLVYLLKKKNGKPDETGEYSER